MRAPFQPLGISQLMERGTGHDANEAKLKLKSYSPFPRCGFGLGSTDGMVLLLSISVSITPVRPVDKRLGHVTYSTNV